MRDRIIKLFYYIDGMIASNFSNTYCRNVITCCVNSKSKVCLWLAQLQGSRTMSKSSKNGYTMVREYFSSVEIFLIHSDNFSALIKVINCWHNCYCLTVPVVNLSISERILSCVEGDCLAIGDYFVSSLRDGEVVCGFLVWVVVGLVLK